MMTDDEVTMAVEACSAMPYFPAAGGARAMIGLELGRMCGSLQQALWLVSRASQLYTNWPGIRELRATLCGKYKPADGLEVCSEVYADGIPSEKESMRQITSGEPAQITDAQSGKIVAEIAAARRMV